MRQKSKIILASLALMALVIVSPGTARANLVQFDVFGSFEGCCTDVNFGFFGTTFTINETSGLGILEGTVRNKTHDELWRIYGEFQGLSLGPSQVNWLTAPANQPFLASQGVSPHPYLNIPYNGMFDDIYNDAFYYPWSSVHLEYLDFELFLTPLEANPQYAGPQHMFGKHFSNLEGSVFLDEIEGFKFLYDDNQWPYLWVPDAYGSWNAQAWIENDQGQLIADFHWVQLQNPRIPGTPEIPEPGTLALVGAGLIGFAFKRRRLS